MGMHIRTSSMLIYMYHEHHQTIFVLDVSEERKKQFLIRFKVVYKLSLTLRNRLQLGIFWREILLLLFFV